MSKFQIGATVSEMFEVHSNPDYGDVQSLATLPRRMVRSLSGVVLVQLGLMHRRWRGNIQFDSRSLVSKLRALYESDSFYFLDETEIVAAYDPVVLTDDAGDTIVDSDGNPITDSGVSLQHDPVLVRWDGEFKVVYEHPEIYTGVVMFEFVTVQATDPSAAEHSVVGPA